MTTPRRVSILGSVGLVFLVAACGAQPRGIHHVVRRGENLFRIGKAYGVPYPELARRNGITDPSRIEVGQKIFVPGATRTLPVDVIAPRFTDTASEPVRFPPGAHPFAWPMREGRLTSRFGPRNGTVHDGIDIAAAEGTPIHAAARGRVIYSDRIPGYGNIVILDHGQELSTVYAHNRENEVRDGQVVEQGQRLGVVGRSGRTTGPNLHFEVRVRNAARNPLPYLPPLGSDGAGVSP